MSNTIKKWSILAFLVIICIFLYIVREVTIPFIISFILVYLLAPIVDFITKQKLFGKNFSRGFSVIIIYIFFFVFLFVVLILIIPALYDDIVKLAKEIPNQINNFRKTQLPALTQFFQNISDKTGFNFELDMDKYITDYIDRVLHSSEIKVSSIAEQTKLVISGIFSALTFFLLIFIVTAFVLVDLPKILTGLKNILPEDLKQPAKELIEAINKDLSGAIRGQLIICLVNGILTTIGLLILKVKFAVTIGLIAGIFSIIPVFGSVISTIPAVLIALTQSWITALLVLIIIIIIHLIEANFLNPKIMGHSVELHPAIILFAIVVGEHFFGIIGLLIGVPIAAIIRSILKYIYYKFYYKEPLNSKPLDNSQ